MITFTGPNAGNEVEATQGGRWIATLLWDGETLHDLEGRAPEKAVQECIVNLETLENNGVFHASV